MTLRVLAATLLCITLSARAENLFTNSQVVAGLDQESSTYIGGGIRAFVAGALRGGYFALKLTDRCDASEIVTGDVYDIIRVVAVDQPDGDAQMSIVTIVALICGWNWSATDNKLVWLKPLTSEEPK